MITLCPEGEVEITIENQEEKKAYETLLDYYDGNENRAYQAFYGWYRSNDEELLRDRISSYTMEGFTVSQQQQTVDTMKWFTMKILTADDGNPHPNVYKDGLPNMGKVKSFVYNIFDNQLRERFAGDGFRQEMIDRILENYDQFWSRNHQRLKEIGLEVDSDTRNIHEIAGGDFVRRNWDDNARFEIDPKDTASTKIKTALSFIPKVEYKRDDDGNIVEENGVKQTTRAEGFLGPRFASMDTIYDNIGRVLADFVPEANTDKFDAYIDRLKESVEGNAQLERAVSEIEERAKDDDNFKFDFVNAFGKTYTKSLTATFKPNISTDPRTGLQSTSGWTMRVFETNRTSQKNAIKQDWFEDQKNLSIVSQDQDGDLRIDKSAVQQLENEYKNKISQFDNKKSDEALRVVQEYLSKIGVSVPLSALQEISKNPGRVSSKTHSWNFHVGVNNGGLNSKGMMGAIFNTLGKESENLEEAAEESDYGKLGVNNPIYGADSETFVDRLAAITADKESSVYAPSFINGENNQVYALQDHTILTKTFGKLKHRPENALENEGVFNRESKILQAIQNDRADIRDIMDLHYMDVLREYRRSRGTSYDEMSTAEKELTRLSLFQRPQRNGRVRFLSPTLSDKTRDYIMTLPQVQNLYNEKKWLTSRFTTIDEDGNLNLYTKDDGKLYSGIEGRVLYDMAQGEIKRILKMQKWVKKNDTDHPLGEDYAKAAQRFLMFPELNPENLSESERDNIYDGNTLKDPSNNDVARETIEKVLLDKLQRKVENTKERWKDLGIAEEGGQASEFMMDSRYLKSIPYRMRNGDRKLTYAALDYQLSQRFFNSNILQILPGDPAQHIKGDLDANSSLEVHEKTMTNLQKRLADHIAPAITANWAERRDKVKMLTMEDRFIDSKHLEEYQGMLSESLAENYEGIESTDAQEYTTFKEHLIMARSHGKVRERVYNALINKIDEVRQDPENEDNYFTIKEAFRESDEIRNEEVDELYDQFYLMPHKPVYVGEKYYEHLGSSHVMYRKTSSWPLIPEMTKGTDLDNLRLAMEGNGETERVHRAAFQSADKLGAYNPVNPFEDNDRQTFTETNLQSEESRGLVDAFKSFDEVDPNEANIQELDRDNLGLQFELPYNDKGVTLVSQMNRLLPHAIKDVSGFEIEGQEMSGQQVAEKKQEYRKQMFETAKESLFEDLGVSEIKNSAGEVTDYEFESMETLQNILLDEAEARDWDPSAIDALELNEDGNFVIPLSFTPNTESIESLLNSLIDNRIIGQNMYGSNYVQTTGAGWHEIGNNSPIAVTERYDPEEGLKHVRTDEDGNVLPAQALIPWNFKDSDGNLLDINKFTKTIETEDGKQRRVIDDDKLDPELRKFIGARIPYQSKSSSMPLEIVGFLPPTVKKLMVVTDETVAQMGSDFDVDKVTTYETKYTYDGENLRPSEEGDSNFDEMDAIKKKYKDLHWEVLTHPDVMPQVIQPLDSPYLSNEADRIENMKPGSDARTDFLNPHQQVEDHNNQQAGNDLIGIFSNFSNLNAMMESYPQEMKGSIPSNSGGSRTVDRVVKYKRRGENGNITTHSLNRVGGEDADVEMPDGSTGTIGDVLEMLQNASLDNAKELVLDKINATTNTANVISTLAMLNDEESGIPLDHLARFFAQPAIKRLDEEINRLESQINDEFISRDTQEEAIDRVLDELNSRYEGELEPLRKEKVEENEVINADIPSLRSLNNSLSKSFDSENKNFIETQRDVLDAYVGLYEISKALSQIQGTVNWGNRNGPGKSLLHSKNKTESYNNLGKNPIFANPKSIVENPDGSLTEWGSAAHNSFILANKLYDDLFHYNSTIFENVKHEMDQQTDNGIDPDQALKVFRNLRSFVFSSDGILNMEGFTVEGERQRLLFGENNIAKKVKEAKDDWGDDSFFVQRLRPEQPESENEPAIVNYSSDKGEKTDEIRIIQDFAGMLVSNDDAKRELARDLVKYSFLVGGGTQSPTSYHDKVPLGYLIQQGLRESIDNFEFGNETGLSSRFKEQYYQHNPKDARILTDDEVNIIRKDQDDKKMVKLDIDTNKVPALFERQPKGGWEAKYEYLSRYDDSADKWRLYRQLGPELYYEIDTLGDGPNTKEYNANKYKTIDKSLIEENRARTEDSNLFRVGESDPDPVVQHEETGNSPSEWLQNRNEISADQYIDSVKKNIDDPYTIELLEFVENIDTNFDIQILSDTEFRNKFNIDYASQGRYVSNEDQIYLNRDELNNESDNHIARTVLHEWIHKKTSEVYEMNENERTDRQQDLMLNLYNLMNEAVEKNKKDAPVGIFEDADKSNDPIFMEFMAWAVANKEGQRWLSDMEVGTKNKSMLEEIIDRLTELVTDILEVSGYDISENSSLKYTVRDTLNLIETTKARDEGKVDDNPESMSKEERAEQKNEENQTDDNPAEQAEKLKMQFTETVKQNKDEGMDQRTPLEQQATLNKTIGEVRSTLTDRQKEIFDNNRNRFQTEC